jgi:hypothetical protein
VLIADLPYNPNSTISFWLVEAEVSSRTSFPHSGKWLCLGFDVSAWFSLLLQKSAAQHKHANFLRTELKPLALLL